MEDVGADGVEGVEEAMVEADKWAEGCVVGMALFEGSLGEEVDWSVELEENGGDAYVDGHGSLGRNDVLDVSWNTVRYGCWDDSQSLDCLVSTGTVCGFRLFDSGNADASFVDAGVVGEA